MAYLFGVLVGTMVSLPAVQRVSVWAVNDGINARGDSPGDVSCDMKPDAALDPAERTDEQTEGGQ